MGEVVSSGGKVHHLLSREVRQGKVVVGEVLKGAEAKVILIDIGQDEINVVAIGTGCQTRKGVLLEGLTNSVVGPVPVDKLIHLVNGSHAGHGSGTDVER